MNNNRLEEKRNGGKKKELLYYIKNQAIRVEYKTLNPVSCIKNMPRNGPKARARAVLKENILTLSPIIIGGTQ